MIFSKSRYKIKDEDRQFLDYLPPVSIFLGGVVFLFGILLSIILYETPNGSYQLLDQFLSELGIRRDYVVDNGSDIRYAPPHPDIFNITLYASGFLMIPFFFFSYRQMRNSSRLSNFFLLIAIIAGVIAGPVLIGVGVFDLSFVGPALWQNHGFWAAGFYLLLTVISLSWALMLISSAALPYASTRWIFLDYILLLVLILLSVLNLADGLGLVMIDTLPWIQSFPVQAYQKMIAVVFFGYFGLVVGTRLTKTKYDNTPVQNGASKKVGATDLFCTNCGEENPITSPFCTNCGVKLR